MVGVNDIMGNRNQRVDQPGECLVLIERVAELKEDHGHAVELELRVLSGENENQIGKSHSECFPLCGSGCQKLAVLIDLCGNLSHDGVHMLLGKRVGVRLIRNEWVNTSSLSVEEFKLP